MLRSAVDKVVNSIAYNWPDNWPSTAAAAVAADSMDDRIDLVVIVDSMAFDLVVAYWTNNDWLDNWLMKADRRPSAVLAVACLAEDQADVD